jgi:hypothetical protein
MSDVWLIHVDGRYWHGREGMPARERRVDNWCLANGWSYLRFTDDWLQRHAAFCETLIKRFLEGRIVALVC